MTLSLSKFLGMTLSLNKKSLWGFFPCAVDFAFDEKILQRFLPVLETSCLSEKSLWGFPTVLETLSLSKKIPIGNLQNPYRDDFEFERKDPYRDFFPVLETLSLSEKNPYRDFPLYWRL